MASLSTFQDILSENKKACVSIASYLVATLVIVYVILNYLLPQYDEIDGLRSDIADTMKATDQIRKNGFTAAQFRSTAGAHGINVSSLTGDMQQLDAVLKKPSTYKKDYLTWVFDYNKKMGDRNKIIAFNQDALSDILPVFASINPINAVAISTSGRHQITLNTFTVFVENVILRGFHLVSESTISVHDIGFDSGSGGTTNIGSFRVSLDFRGKNRDIRSMINYLQNSGRFRIENGQLINILQANPKITDPTIPNNLLVDIVSLELQKGISNDADTNGGTMVLKFFVEGIGFEEVTTLRSQVLDTYDQLTKNIAAGVSACDKNATLCTTDRVYQAVSKLQSLQTNVASYKAQTMDIKKRTKITDAQGEFDELVILNRSLETIRLQADQLLSILNVKPDTKSSASTGTGAASGQ